MPTTIDEVVEDILRDTGFDHPRPIEQHVYETALSIAKQIPIHTATTNDVYESYIRPRNRSKMVYYLV